MKKYREDGKFHNLKEDECMEEHTNQKPLPSDEGKYIPLQLCPKCYGDGHLLRYNSPNVYSDTPTCDVCDGNKVIPMMRDNYHPQTKPLPSNEEIENEFSNRVYPINEFADDSKKVIFFKAAKWMRDNYQDKQINCEDRKLLIEKCVTIFEETACKETYKMVDGIAAVVDYLKLNK